MAKQKLRNSFKIGKSVKINRWLLLGFVAVVVASAIVIVRYSGASGEVYSVHSTRVSVRGGETHMKSNGSWYWVGNYGTSLSLNLLGMSSLRNICLEGSFAQSGTKIIMEELSAKVPKQPASITFSGDKGQFSKCLIVSQDNIALTVVPKSGAMVFNRFAVK